MPQKWGFAKATQNAGPWLGSWIRLRHLASILVALICKFAKQSISQGEKAYLIDLLSSRVK